MRFARAPWQEAAKDIPRLDTAVGGSAEQNALGGHRDAGEMSAAIAERLADQRQPRLADPLGKIRPQLLAPDARGEAAEVVVGVHLPPGVEDRPAWRFLQQA